MVKFIRIATVLATAFGTLALGTPAFSATKVTPGQTTKATAVSAVSATASQADVDAAFQAYKIATAATKVAKAAAVVQKEIDVRIARLNALLTTVTATKRENDADRTKLSGDIQTEITAISALKDKLNTATTLEEVRAVQKELIQGHYVFAVGAPTFRATNAINHLNFVATQLAGISQKLSAKVATLKTQGVATAEMETLLTTVDTAIATAKTSINKATTDLKTVKDPTTAKTGLASVQTSLVAAQQNLKAATDALKNVVNLIKASVATSGTTTPATTATTPATTKATATPTARVTATP